jgi:hypothetical protein
MVACVVVAVVAVVFKYRWHERFFAPSVHAVRAEGGHVSLEPVSSEWVRALFGQDFLATATSLSLHNAELSACALAAPSPALSVASGSH